MTRKEFLLRRMTSSSTACSVKNVASTTQKKLEQIVYSSSTKQREAEIAVFINAMNVEFLALHSNLKNMPKKGFSTR